jgi:hypothetical protein
VLLDGRVAARRPTLGRLAFAIPPAFALRPEAPPQVNVAVNNGRGAYPWIDVSFAAPENPPTYLIDGNYWYLREPPNRWTTIGSPHASDTVVVDFGAERVVQDVTLYVLDDGDSTAVRSPARVQADLWRGGRWLPVTGTPALQRPAGHRANRVSFAATRAERVRVVLWPQPGAAVGLSEIEAWGPAQSLREGTRSSADLAFNAGGAAYPRALASFTSPSDRVEDVNDLRVAFTRYSRNRWTAYGTPNASDWLEIDLDSPRMVRTIELYLWGDGAGVQAPRAITVRVWRDGAWQDARVLSRQPMQPLVGARNVIRIAPEGTDKVRVVFEHDLPAVSGVTELIVR